MGFCSQCGAQINEGARFCGKCGTAVSGVNTSTEWNNWARKEIYEGEVRKCPNCGDPIDAFEFVCDKCGFNFSTNRMSNSQERLAAQLKAIEQKGLKETKKDVIANKIEKATCINSFPVANSIEEIVSFMVYAAGNIDMGCLSTSAESLADYDKGDRQIAEAWIGKMDQMYHMAKISFSDSPKFPQIEHIYNEKRKEIKKASKKKILSNVWVWFVLLIGAIMAISAVIGIMAFQARTKDRPRLEAMGAIFPGYPSRYIKENYRVVVKQFEDMGFVDIETIDLDDASFWKKEDTVESVSIKGDKHFSEDDYFNADDKVIIAYH